MGQTRTLTGSIGWVQKVSVTPDHKHIFTIAREVVKVWDADVGQKRPLGASGRSHLGSWTAPPAGACLATGLLCNS